MANNYVIDFPKLKDTDMADLEQYTADLADALSAELLKFNSQLAEAQKDFENLGKEVEENIKELEDTKTFIENSMKTLSAEGTSIHVNDSADYPCKLEIEGKSEQVQTEQGKNLLPFKDINFTLKGVNFYTENGNLYLNGASTGEILTNDNAYITYFSFILPVGTYKFKHFSSLNVNMAIQLKKVSDKSELAGINLNSNTVKTFTLNEETEVYLGIYIYNQNFNNENLKLMLSIEDATEYEPFVPDSPSPNYPSEIENVSGDLEVKVLKQNLFMKQGLSTPTNTENFWNSFMNTTPLEDGWCKVEVNNTGTTVAYANQFVKKGNIDKIKPDTDYIIWAEFRNVKTLNTIDGYILLCGDSNICIWNSNITALLTSISEGKKIIQKVKTKSDISNTTLDLRNFVSVNAGTSITFEYRMMILEDIYTDEELQKITYEDYNSQTVTFPFSEGQKLMAGGYLGENGVVNKRKQVVLDGMESWTLYSSSLNALRYSIYITISDMYISAGGLDDVHSNYFIGDGSSESTEEFANKFTIRRANGSNKVYFFIPKDFFEATTANEIIAEWKAYLAEQNTAGTPVILEYPLAEEETTAYTSEQQTAYNTLQKFKTYRTTTNISNSQNTNMQLTYKKDLQTQFQELETMLLESGV